MSIGNFFWRPIDLIGCLVASPFFVGGWNIESVLKRGAELKKQGYKITYNLLGEHAINLKDVFRAQDATIQLIRAMNDENRGNVAIKPTLYGLDIDKEVFFIRAGKIVLSAKEKGIEVEFDAESRSTIPDTFEIFNRFASKFPYCNFVRQCVQAHLTDIFQLMDEYQLWDKQLRVVKGAGVYEEEDGVVLQDTDEVMRQYYAIIERNYSQEGQVPYIATMRDDSIPLHVDSISPKSYVRPYRPITEMLYGPLGRGLGKKLLKEDRDVRIYLPFVMGHMDFSWYSYSLRRASMMRRLIWEEIEESLSHPDTSGTIPW